MNAASPLNRPRGPGRVQFLLLAVLFFTPFIGAWLLYFYYPQHRPTGTTNYGELVSPVRELPAWSWLKPDGSSVTTEELRNKWTLLQLASGGCDDACAQRVLLSRQLRTALAANRDLVQRVLLTDDAAALAGLQQRLGAEHPDLMLRAASIDTRFFGPREAGALYLIDPFGNYMMVYPDRGTQEDFKGMQKDFKRLLKQSQS
ncbi:MAG: hypothetical protein JWQ90_5685 [Hydrocarboniphaga sp.]|uniref:hypothetical protein n=1 Tax=Hydrocarboniphaga sp. TaxID=2033016 RepID=UPI00263891C7|nr:hypothetical protein [Hydrocarboniphaga sp.]MDB5973235.1 hypothetical protein [Hydrocarboniphaga sp.]